MLHVAQGLVGGYSLLDKFGRNADVSSGVPADVWPGGGLYTGFPTGAPETISVFSSSTSDTFGGAGAGQIVLVGLGSNWEEQTEVVSLNGTTPVVTTKTWRRMSRARVLRSANGANTSFNLGSITARYTTTTSVVFMVMTIGMNQTSTACYTVPAGKAFFLDKLILELDRATTATILGALYAKTDGSAPWISRVLSASNARGYYNDFKFSLRYPEKTDIALRVVTASGNNLDVLGSFQGVLAPF